MAMKLFSSDDQPVAGFDANEQHNHIFHRVVNILQHSEMLDTNLKLGQGIRS
jgi:hypothetical protein